MNKYIQELLAITLIFMDGQFTWRLATILKSHSKIIYSLLKMQCFQLIH
jgi:hypothetical protein